MHSAIASITPDKKVGFRPDIEGLRGMAVLLVLLNHVTSWFTGGYVGVDVFFVISGFLITLLLIRELEQTGRIAFDKFYARRVRRILPAATVVIVATMCGSWLWGPSTQHHSVSIDGMLSAVSGINYRLATSGTDYFANTTPSPFQHYWSLAVEEQFYLFWPLLLVAAWVVGKWFGKAWPALGVTLILVTAGSVWLSVTVTQSSQPWAYFGLPTRAWELAVGGIVALVGTALSRHLQAWLAAAMTWVGFGLIGVAAWSFDDSTSFPGYIAMVPVCGAALVIAGGCVASRFGAQAVLGLMPLRFVGKISYSLYLWHWPVVVLAPSFLGRELTGLDRAAVAALSFVLAIISYYAVEEPFRRSKSLAADPNKALAVGGSTIFATALAMAALAFIVVPLPKGGNAEAKELPPIAAADIPKAVAEGAQQEKLTPEVITALPVAVRDKYPHQCLLGEFTAIEPTTCIIGDESAKVTGVIFGDSHVTQWYAALKQIGKERNIRFVVLAKGSCTPEGLVYNIERLKRSFVECGQWTNKALAMIDQLHPRMAIVSTKIREGATTVHMERLVKRLKSSGARVAVLDDTPDPPQNIPDCLSLNEDRATKCAIPRDKALYKPAERQARKEGAKRAGATFVDPANWFCTKTVCPAVIANRLVYRDDDHITSSYAKLLVPALDDALGPVLN